MKKILAILLVALLAACSQVALTGRKQLMLVSDEQVLDMSKRAYQEYMMKAKRSDRTAAIAMVNRVGTRIANAVERYLAANGMQKEIKNFAWEFNLVKEPTPNAFCMPGGKIVVNEGILPYTQTEEGLAIVLGHEVGHAVAKHAAERMSRQIATSVGGTVLGTVLSGQGTATRQIAEQVYGLGAQYGVMLPYSRKSESEADRLGLIFAAMAGYNPNSAVAFWQRMAASGGGKVPEFMSTHPSDQTRIKHIQALLPEAMQYYHGKGSITPGKSIITPGNPIPVKEVKSGKKKTQKQSFRFEPVS